MKVLTLNLDCHKTWSEKKDLVIKNLKDIDADIVCLQELSSKQESSSTFFTNEAVEIANEMNYIGHFSASHLCSPNQGIFTKKNGLNVKEKHHFSFSGILPDGSTEKHRRFLIAQLLENKKGEELLVINLHLSVLKEFRYKSWEEIMLWLSKNNMLDKNILITGDFNTYEEEDVHKEIMGSGFKNAWEEVNKEPCITYRSSDWWIRNHPNDIHTESLVRREKVWPEGCLDYFFYKGNLNINSVEYLDLVPMVTDHKGLILDFDVV